MATAAQIRKPKSPRDSSSWSVQDAKAKFSELLDSARQSGPQRITRHGEETAVVVSSAEYKRLTGDGAPSLYEVLFDLGPKYSEQEYEEIFNQPRQIDPEREIDL